MATTLIARRLVTDSGIVEFPVVTLANDGTIASIENDPRALADETTTLTAAYFDVHTHGAMGHDVMSATPTNLAEMQRFLAGHGVAHYLPTTVTASIDATLRSLESLAEAVESTPYESGARPVGIHLEGPFLSHAKRGVHPVAELQRPSVDLFDRFYAAARSHITLMTIAPELPGSTELIAHATARGVRCSVGHSDATAAETIAGINAGATSATHTFNAMRTLDHREPGILGTVLDDDRLFAELICDGIHVAPAMVRLWLKSKGYARGILVTDAMAAAGMPDGAYALGGLAVRVADGRALLQEDFARGKDTLAGSLLTMDRALENLRSFTGIAVSEAAAMASRTPAVMIGKPELAQVAVGAIANLNRLDENGRLIETYLHGKLIAP